MPNRPVHAVEKRHICPWVHLLLATNDAIHYRAIHYSSVVKRPLSQLEHPSSIPASDTHHSLRALTVSILVLVLATGTSNGSCSDALTLQISDWLFHSEGGASCDWAAILSVAFFPILNYISDMSFGYTYVIIQMCVLINEWFSFWSITNICIIKTNNVAKRLTNSVPLGWWVYTQTHTHRCVLVHHQRKSIKLSDQLSRVAYSTIVKFQDNPSPSVHCYLSLHCLAWIFHPSIMRPQRFYNGLHLTLTSIEFVMVLLVIALNHFPEHMHILLTSIHHHTKTLVKLSGIPYPIYFSMSLLSIWPYNRG